MLKRCVSLLIALSIQTPAFSSMCAEEERGFFDFFLPPKKEEPVKKEEIIPTPPKPYNLIVIGCARSGTAYTKKLLSKLTLPINEETSKFDYFVGWTMGDDCLSMTHPKPRPCSDYANVFHQVRDPLKTISSLYANFSGLHRGIWPFVRAHIPEILDSDDLLVTCAKYYYYWNKKCEERTTYRFQVEQIAKAAPEFEKSAGITLDQAILNKMPTHINHWRTIEHTYTWKELDEALPEELARNLRIQAQAYGYAVK